MTRDELEDFLKDSIVPKLEQAWIDLEASRAREEERSQDLEREREARKKAERAAADKDAEIEALKKALADARDTKATDRRDRFGSRGRKVIAELLEGKNIKAVHTDGYNAYFFLEGTGVVHITCAAHVWRYIMDWYNATGDERARRLLTEISAIYTVESEIRGKAPEEILNRRLSTEVTEILTRYKAMLDSLELIRDTLPAIGQKAVSYALTQYPKMERWREDPDYDIDNNFAERSARPVALERKNRMHHASHRGAEASCVIRSVVETCRMWGKSVRDFFLAYFSGVVSGRADYDALMPWATTATC